MCAEFVGRISTIKRSRLIVCAFQDLSAKMLSRLLESLVLCAFGEIAHAHSSPCARRDDRTFHWGRIVLRSFLFGHKRLRSAMGLSPAITETRRVHFLRHTSSYRFLKAAFGAIGARYWRGSIPSAFARASTNHGSNMLISPWRECRGADILLGIQH
jgi:hypothetical protein